MTAAIDGIRHLLGRTPRSDAYSALLLARAQLRTYEREGATAEQLRAVVRLLDGAAAVLGDDVRRDVA